MRAMNVSVALYLNLIWKTNSFSALSMRAMNVSDNHPIDNIAYIFGFQCPIHAGDECIEQYPQLLTKLE